MDEYQLLKEVFELAELLDTEYEDKLVLRVWSESLEKEIDIKFEFEDGELKTAYAE